MVDEHYPEEPDAEEVILVSKSEMKRDMQERQQLGENLTKLNKQQLEKIPLDESLREAIADHQRFKHREAKRRQLQFIGKLMRDADVEAIQRAWELSQAGSEAAKKAQHKLEYWRDRLISEGDAAINTVVDEYPTLDRQQLRQLIRQSHKEAEHNKPPAASRKLFKYLREVLYP